MSNGWQDWIDRALAKAPEDRFQSAQEMADALSALDGRGASVPPPSRPHVRISTWTVAVAASAVAVAALAGWATWGRHRAPVVSASGTTAPAAPAVPVSNRSEERRVGKGWRGRGWACR